jgi:iron complex outermembrane recepter protein
MRSLIVTLAVAVAAAPAWATTTVTGKVVDATSGKPVAQCHVEALETHETALSDEAGAFSLALTGSPPLTLVVSHEGYRVARRALAALPPQPLQIALEPVVSYADRIEVTATRAQEGTDPVTFTNIPQQRVKEAYWGQDPAILLSQVSPGFYSYNDSGNGIGYSYFWIRGFNQALTRVTLNGAPLNDAEDGELYFIDLADFLSTAGDVQIQRGVFGLSGIGGAVDVTTAPPSLEPAFSLESGLGSFGTKRYTVRYDSGLIAGTWALSARYSKITTEGYRDQSWVEMWNYYISLAHFGDRSRLRLVLFGGPENTHLAYEGIPKATLETDRRFNPLTYPGEQDHFTQPHFQIVHELAISSETQLAQTFFLFQGSGYYDEYKTGRNLFEYDLPDVTLPDGTVVTTSDLVRRRQVDEWDAGWVPTVTHTAGDWTFTVRGELRLHSGRHFGAVEWAQFYPQGVPPDHRYYDYQVDKQSEALAATASWRASEAWTLSAGLEGARRSYQLSHDALKGVAFTDTFNFVLPRAGAIFHASPTADVYFNVARGMHEPAFRTIYDPEDYYGERIDLDPEDVWDWEAGVSLRSPTWRARANVFWMAFANEIVYAGKLDSSGVPIYGNGARSRHRGIELDATWEPCERLGFDLAASLSRNTFTRYHDYNDDGSLNVYDGNKIAGYPDVMGSLTVRTRLDGVRLALTGRRVGSFYLDNTQDNRRNPEARRQPGYVPLINPAFSVVDLTVRADLPGPLVQALGLDALAVELRVNDLLDATYTAFGYLGDDGAPVFIPAAGRNYFVALRLGL